MTFSCVTKTVFIFERKFECMCDVGISNIGNIAVLIKIKKDCCEKQPTSITFEGIEPENLADWCRIIKRNKIQ